MPAQPPTEIVALFPILSVDHLHGFKPGPMREEAYRLAAELAVLGRSLTISALEDAGTYVAELVVGSHEDQRFPKPRGQRGMAYVAKPHGLSPRAWLTAKLTVSLEIEVREPAVKQSGVGSEELSDAETVALIKHGAVHDIARWIFDLCCTANIAAPGAFEIGAPFIYSDGALVHTSSPMISSLSEAREYAQRTGWPSIGSLPLSDAMAWVQQLDLPQRVGDSPVSRAYNAWTYQFEQPGRDDPVVLFWALMGVEALFNDGREGVREQVFRRSQLLLGERVAHKQDLGEMYRVRSAFVHGSLPFAARDFPYDAMPSFKAYIGKVYGATSVAQAVLVAALQELVRRRWSGMEFDTVLRGAAMPSKGSPAA